MHINRLKLLGAVTVSLVAAAKTALVIGFSGGLSSVTIPSGMMIFIGLWLLTAAVAVGGFAAVRRCVETSRRSRILTHIGKEPGKENLIEAHAQAWGLTKAETDIAIMVVKGFSNTEIAAMRGSALQTVKTQMSAIYQKSGLDGRYQLLAYITDEVCEASKVTSQGAIPDAVALRRRKPNERAFQ